MVRVAASTMAEVFTYELTSGGVGAGATVLGWLSSFFLILITLGVFIMIRIIQGPQPVIHPIDFLRVVDIHGLLSREKLCNSLIDHPQHC
jgi:hypothetical protein